MSIYELKTSVSELSSANDATSKMMYEQHPPTRDVTGGNFPNGAIHIRWQTSGQKWWVPSRSYIRTTLKITKGNGTQLLQSDDVAPNMGLCANMYQSAEFRIADKTVSRVSDYMPQVDALETRLNKSKAWIDSLGASTNWWQTEQKDRKAQITKDGVIQSNIPAYDAPLSRVALGFDAPDGGAADRNAGAYTDADGLLIFSANGGAGLPADVRELFPIGSKFTYTSIFGAPADDPRLNTPVIVVAHVNATTIKLQQGVIGDVPADGRNDWRVELRKIEQYENLARGIDTFELTWQPPLSIFKVGHAIPSGKFELVLNPQTASQYQQRAIETLLANKAPGLTVNDFKVEVVDMYLYIATVEGARMDNGTYLLDLNETRCQVDNMNAGGAFQQKNFDVSPSTYALTTCFQDERAGNNTLYSASKFKANGDDELKLNRLFINYAGVNKPQPDANPIFDGTVDRTTQRYVESQLNSGAYFDCGGAETIEEYHKRGSYYYFSWPRDGTDRSTRVNVHFGFSAAQPNTRVLLFDHSKKVASISVADGNVVSVMVEDQ
jgi:hypothetical protein